MATGREVTFHIAGNEDVQNARYPRIFITDTEGRRYEVPNCEHFGFGLAPNVRTLFLKIVCR